MALSDVAIRNARPQAKPYKLADSGGLYLFVTPAGGKLWRMKFRVAGKEKLLAFGGWPAVSLAIARKERDQARESLAAGADPSREKQQAKHRAKLNRQGRAQHHNSRHPRFRSSRYSFPLRSLLLLRG